MVVSWGNPRYGGESSGVQHLLKNVEQIVHCGDSFAAIRQGGSVVTWGNRCANTDDVKDLLLSGVQAIQATHHAFAALKIDGSVVTWGNMDRGGDSTSVQHALQDVCHVQSTGANFVAETSSGQLVLWGHLKRMVRPEDW